MAKFKHLRPLESELWQRALDVKLFPSDAKFEYDVTLGEGMPSNDAWEGYINVMAKALTQRRLDVLVKMPNSRTIVEIKDTAGASAIGQLMLYKQLYEQQYKPPSPPNMMILANYKGFDLDGLIGNLNIAVVLLPPKTE